MADFANCLEFTEDDHLQPDSDAVMDAGFVDDQSGL